MSEQQPLYRATHSYAARQSDELTVKAGDTVRITHCESDDWWHAENMETGQAGLVPSNFLEKVGANTALATVSETTEDQVVLAKVIQDFEAQSSDELTLWKDGVVTVLDQSVGEGWWKGDLNGKIGIFPANHVKLVDPVNEAQPEEGRRKSTFKLAAYGVKEGGIGSILAGGMGLRKKPPQPDVKPTPAPQPVASVSQDNVVERKKGMVLHDYEPENEDEIRLMRGEYVTIIDKMEDQGWWKGTNEAGQSGLFPSNFVQVVEEQPPQRPPPRKRPPTIKTDTMARPPPVPVATRPQALLTHRNQESSRPKTSPPLPATRPPSVTESTSRLGHKKTPSVPLVSPDLPPVTPNNHAPARPTRPIPTPGSSTPRTSVDRSSTCSEPPAPLAKPPKVNAKQTPGGPTPPVRPTPSISRPLSQTPPRPPPSSTDTTTNERKSSSSEPPLSPPPMPRRSMPPPPLTESRDDWIKKEFEKLRSLLEAERAERLRLEQELKELKARLGVE